MSARTLSKGFIAGACSALVLAACGGGGGGGYGSNMPAPTYTIGGTATGLTGTVVLQNNAGDNLSVTANGTFAFATPVASGRPYAVTVLTQPAGETCTVTSGSGTAAATVTSVAVTCVGMLSVVSSAPANNGVSVDRVLPLTITYSAPLNATGLASTVTLTNPGVVDAFTVAAAGTQLQITPSGPLTLLAPHTLGVSTAIRGTGGEAPAAAFSINFTTRDGFWRGPMQMQAASTGDGQDPDIAFARNGDALAVWDQSDGTHTSIWARSYSFIWGPAMLIETGVGDAMSPHVALDPAGNGIAVWQQQNGTRFDIWANYFTAGSGWGTAQLIETVDTGDAQYPQIAFDSSGNAIAVWEQSDGTHVRIRTNRYTKGTGWGTATTLDTAGNGDAGSPAIAIDANNNAAVVWQQAAGTVSDVWAARYTVAGGWSAPAHLETDNANSAAYPQVAFDLNGNAMAVWVQNDTTGPHVWANRFTSGAWGTPQRVETGSEQAFFPGVAFDGLGNAFAIWEQQGTNYLDIWSARYVAGTGWAPPALLDTEDAGQADSMHVAADLNGNAIAVWEQTDGTHFGIRMRRYQNGTGWGNVRSLEDPTAGDAFFPRVAVDPKGEAFVTWEQQGATQLNVETIRFD